MKPISFVIITYNRPGDMIELAQDISRLQELSSLVEEIIIVNNCSTESYEQVESFIRQHPEMPFRYSMVPENMGVSRGRNYAIQQSKAPILVFLDDDAVFQNDDVLPNIVNIFNETDGDNRLRGIVAFKVYYHATLELQKNAFPHKQFRQRKDLHNFPAPYFAGCAHAIRRRVFDSIGYYPENFFYGMEEYDLSYRTLNAGFSICYDDRVAVLHKESPTGRLPNREKLRGMWINKSRVAWKYLPEFFFYSTFFMWSFEYLRKSGYDLKGYFKGWFELFNIPASEKRTPVNEKCLAYLRKIRARLWY